MKSYLILRNKQKSGPYSLEELRHLPLKPTDLVWISGKSSFWQLPAEFEELKGLFEEPAEMPAGPIRKNTEPAALSRNGVHVSFPAKISVIRSHASQPAPTGQAAPLPQATIPEPIEPLPAAAIAENQEPNRQRNRLPLSLVWLGFIAGGLAFGIMVTKTILDGSRKSARPETTGGMAIAAMSPAVPNLPAKEPLPPSPPPAEPALVRHRPQKTVPATPALRKAPTAKPAAPLAAVNHTPAAADNNWRQQVSVSNNRYETGRWGGIKNLELTANNASPYFLEEVQVEISYFKPNGSLLFTRQAVLKAIPANGSQQVRIPATSRGAKVACRIASIRRRE